MERYWLSAIVKSTENGKPWNLSTYDSTGSIAEALEILERYKKNYIVLSAWIDTFDEQDKKHTVFHECYVDTFGNVKYS